MFFAKNFHMSMRVCGILVIYLDLYLCIHKLNYFICVAKSRCVMLNE